jgi:hypothetical protein
MPTLSKKRYTVHVFDLGGPSRVHMAARSFRWRWTAFLYAVLQVAAGPPPPLCYVSELEDDKTGEYWANWV